MLLFLLTIGCKDQKTSDIQYGDAVELIEFVDPMIATGGIGYAVNCGYPGVGMPFGMVKLSPDTATASGGSDGYYRGGGYHYDDTQIQGFSMLHLYATGITGHGTLATQPSDGIDFTKTNRDGYGLPFSHDREEAEVGRYWVDLNVAEVELRATEHTGLIEYSFTNASNPVVLLDINHSMGRGTVSEGQVQLSEDGQSFQGSLIMDGELGAPYLLFFYGELSTPPESFGVWNASGLSQMTTESVQESEGSEIGAWFEYPEDSVVSLRISVSNVDSDGAFNNFQMEHTGFDLASSQRNVQTAYQEYFDVINVWGGLERDHRIFATALYHNLQMPTLFSDSDGRYRGFDNAIHYADRPFYTDFSLWDTYRTTHPLYTLLWPEKHEDLLWSLVQMSVQGDGLPRWPLGNSDTGVMLGTSINIVIPEALQKGLHGFGETEWIEMTTQAMLGEIPLSYGAPPDIQTYMELGYYPADEVGRSVAWTQEQSIADFALGEWLNQSGDTVRGELLSNRGHNWYNLWDPEIGFIHGRNRDGSFTQLPTEDRWEEDYAEGNARQYLWLAPHDTELLFETLGGKEASLARLEEFFDNMVTDDILPGLPERWYWHGNEPTLHVPYYFALLDEPALGAEWIEWIWNNRYNDTPDGLAGNDDGGALSAWAIFASMGLYPIAGGTDYVISEPIWNKVEVHNVKQNITLVKGNSAEVLLENTPYEDQTLSHTQLTEIQLPNYQ